MSGVIWAIGREQSMIRAPGERKEVRAIAYKPFAIRRKSTQCETLP